MRRFAPCSVPYGEYSTLQCTQLDDLICHARRRVAPTKCPTRTTRRERATVIMPPCHGWYGMNDDVDDEVHDVDVVCFSGGRAGGFEVEGDKKNITTAAVDQRTNQ